MKLEAAKYDAHGAVDRTTVNADWEKTINHSIDPAGGRLLPLDFKRSHQ